MLVTNKSSNDQSAARYIGHKRSHRRGGGFQWRLSAKAVASNGGCFL